MNKVLLSSHTLNVLYIYQRIVGDALSIAYDTCEVKQPKIATFLNSTTMYHPHMFGGWKHFLVLELKKLRVLGYSPITLTFKALRNQKLAFSIFGQPLEDWIYKFFSQQCYLNVWKTSQKNSWNFTKIWFVKGLEGFVENTSMLRIW